MECTSEKCKRKLRKRLQVIHGSVNVSSESSLSSDSDAHFPPFHSLTRKRRKASCHSKRDYLSRLFERKKLKDKSLSKKLKTPFDRKINRTCWPIELSKVSKIKKKPREKRREKPTHRSLTRREYSDCLVVPNLREKSPQITCSELEIRDDVSLYTHMSISNPTLVSCYQGSRPRIVCNKYPINSSDLKSSSRYRARSPSVCCSHIKCLADDTSDFRRQFWKPKNFSQFKASSSQVSCRELEFLNDDSFSIVYQYLNRKPFLYEQVTPEMLLEVLENPEFSETGATIDMIIQEIRVHNKNLNPEIHLLKEEVAIKLLWAITLGIIIEENGYYKIAESFQNEEDNVSLIWDWWYHRMKNIRK